METAAREPVSSESDGGGDEVGDISGDPERSQGGDACNPCRAPDPPREIWLACENPLLPPVLRRPGLGRPPPLLLLLLLLLLPPPPLPPPLPLPEPPPGAALPLPPAPRFA